MRIVNYVALALEAFSQARHSDEGERNAAKGDASKSPPGLRLL
jgi:hypothetical protein